MRATTNRKGYEEESPYVYRVDPETATESGTDYVIRVESGEESAPAESNVYEVRPAEEGTYCRASA